MVKFQKEDYRKEINQIISLLEGNTNQIMKELDKDIKEAADKLEFERAAELRDKNMLFKELQKKDKRFLIYQNTILM